MAVIVDRDDLPLERDFTRQLDRDEPTDGGAQGSVIGHQDGVTASPLLHSMMQGDEQVDQKPGSIEPAPFQ